MWGYYGVDWGRGTIVCLEGGKSPSRVSDTLIPIPYKFNGEGGNPRSRGGGMRTLLWGRLR